MCSHYYSAYPPFEVAEEDADEGALRCAAGLSSGRDLVEEFVAYGVWPLAHGWALGEVCPRQMPSHGGKLVRSPAIVEGFMSYASLVTCEGAMNALSREGCRHYEVFDQADEDFEHDIYKVEDCWGLVLKCYELRTRQHKKC
jgi:hypothetical protein